MTERTESSTEPRYGWVMVAITPILLGFYMGSLGSISVFLKPLVAEFGWLRGETTFAYLISNAGLGLGGILMGLLADRYPTRRIVLFGCVAIGLSYMAMSRQTTLWQFYLYSGLAAGLGGAALFSPLLANVGGWFTRNRGLALGLATAGQALGQGIVPYVSSHLIAALGWRGAFNALGGFSLVVLVPLALLVRNPPTSARSGPETQGDAVEREAEVFPIPPLRSISVLSFAAILCCIPMAVPMVHVVALAMDRGLIPENAARVLLLLMIAGACGRAVFGKLADNFGPLRTYMLASAWQTAMVFWFTRISSPPMFYLAGLLFGFGYGGVMTGLILCAQCFVPTARRGVSTGVVVMFGFLGMGIGGYGGGLLFDITGDYTMSYAFAAISGILNLLVGGSLYVYQSRRIAALKLQGETA